MHRFLERYAQEKGRLLEIGCGGGLEAALLAGQGWEVTTSDLHAEAVRFAKERGIDRVLVFDADGPWPIGEGSFDAILMLDVLEHLDNDGRVLREMCVGLRPGGTAIVTVPAHAYLFSGWDEVFGHKRRYSRRALTAIAADAGFEPVSVSYWNLVSVLPALVMRGGGALFRRHRTRPEFPDVPAWVNACLKVWGRAESACVVAVGLPYGLSLVAVLRKPALQSDEDVP